MSLLEVRGLRAGYERIPVVFDIDLVVEEGEIVAILGANGAGKTTTLRCLSGMVRPMAGEIMFDGRHIDGVAADVIARSSLVHVPQGRGIFPTLDVGESLQLAAAVAGIPRGETAERTEEMYSLFPRLGERRRQLAGTLSGGEQQMLALARGLIVRPRLLLIDEMSQGLAPTVVAQLFELVASFPERGTSVLLVEQFVGKALAVASRAYVLEKGTVSYAGDAQTLAADSEFVRSSYLGSEDRAVAEPSGVRPAAAPPAPIGESITVSLPPALMRSLTERAEREGVALGVLVSQALRGELAAETGDEREPAEAGR